MVKIETGVDRLVILINERKKLSVDEAAKELGVSTLIVQEWADFLEEEGIISIEYSLSKVYLCERKLTKKEVEKKAKDVDARKDVFVRRVETGLKTLELETRDFEKVKEEFLKVKDQIGGELGKVQQELEELKHYEELKKNIDEDIVKQRNEYVKIIETSQSQIKAEERKYLQLLETIEKEEDSIGKEGKELKGLEREEGDLKKRADDLIKSVQGVEERILDENELIDNSQKRLQNLNQIAVKLGEDIKEKKKSLIQPLIELSEEHKQKIITIQDDILDKVRKRKAAIEEFAKEGVQISDNFGKFFERKNETEKMFEKIERDKEEIQKEMEKLIERAKVFNLVSIHSDFKKFVGELEKKYEEIDRKKDGLKEDLRKLSQMIKI